MNKKYIFMTAVVMLLVPASAWAQFGAERTAEVSGLDSTTPAGASLSDVIGNVIGSGLALIGVLFFILMIYAGISWMLARGNEEQSKKALGTITAAIIGLILVIASYAITIFVFRSVSESSSVSQQPQCPAATLGGSGCAGQQISDQCTNQATNQSGICQLNAGGDSCVCR